MDRVRAHVFVSGMVQGVFYRWSAAEQAKNLGVGGWVQNTSDGRVEAVFEGNRASVEALIEWCKQGPPAARVTDVSISWENPAGESQFGIK